MRQLFLYLSGEMEMRLNKYLAQCGVCSRREADRLVEQGRIRINGQTAKVGMEVGPQDDVTADGKKITIQERESFLAVNKPRGVVVTTDRTHGDRLLEDLIDIPQRVFPVGRLDKESEGLILMTNNGDVSNRIQKARGCHEKEYLVTIDKPVSDLLVSSLAAGVRLPELDRTTRPCRVRKTGTNSFDIILTEGMNRQIRRMCGVFDCRVQKLERIRVMNIRLGNLKTGMYRELTRQEVEELKRLTGASDERLQTG